MAPRKALFIASVAALLGAFFPTVVALGVIADNNNNGELYDPVTGRWDLSYAVSVSALFYVVSFLLIFAVSFGLACLRGEDTES
jgi:hypothetical protein